MVLKKGTEHFLHCLYERMQILKSTGGEWFLNFVTTDKLQERTNSIEQILKFDLTYSRLISLHLTGVYCINIIHTYENILFCVEQLFYSLNVLSFYDSNKYISN